ncbi:MAG: hypothetical protein IT373_14160 [Polyangiaceae bacterium]|nr:hypothetical protein [Polyangiaceae bacterium]
MSPRATSLHSGRLAAGVGAIIIIVAPAAARGDWPIARHDTRRTAASPGTSDITKPVAYWRMYLGGRIEEDSALAADVDADGATDVVYVDSGRVVARRPDGDLLWQSDNLGISRLVGVADLEGDAVPDVVAVSSDHAYVFGGPDGGLEWAEPDGEMGTLATARLADLDGDTRPDLLLQELGCGSVNSGETGFAYSFAGGFGAAAVLYELPWHACGAASTTVVDLDGSGTTGLLVASTTNEGLALLDGGTGVPLAVTAPFTQFVSLATCAAVGLDAVPGDELLCSQNEPGYGGEREVFALRYAPGPPASLSVAWRHVIADKVDGDLEMNADSVGDLDGDGAVEVVVAGKAAAGWTTYVYAGSSGAELATIPLARFSGTAATTQPSRRTIFAQLGQTLAAFHFDAATNPLVSAGWTLPGRTLRAGLDWAASARQSLRHRATHADLDADGREDVVVTVAAAGGALEAYSGAGAAAVLLGTVAFPELVEPEVFWVMPPFGSGGASVALGRNDGYLSLLDGALQSMWGGDTGIRVGGYYSNLIKVGLAPVAAPLGEPGGPDSVLLVDSRGALQRIDPVDAAFVAPPKPLWALRGLAPAVVPGGPQGGSAIACFRRVEAPGEDPAYAVALLRPDGTSVWTQPYPWTPALDLLPGRLDGGAVPDLFVQGYDAQTSIHTRAISGADGSTLWDYGPAVPMLGGVQLYSAADWDGDARSDLLTVLGSLRVVSGTDGSDIAISPADYGYFAPIPYDVDGDAVEEVTLQGGAQPVRTLRHDLATPVWTSDDADTPIPYGAVVECQAAAPRLVQGSHAHPARLKLTPLSGAQAGAYSTLVLAGGMRYDSETAALADGAHPAQLGRVSVEADLTGTQRPSAVVGAADGWLYAVNPCTGALDFSLYFDAAVGEPIFADTDGDGRDEILVTVADGYLYDVRNWVINAPSYVWDIDPAHGVVDHDLAEVETRDSLSGRWGSVAGATGYEVAIVNAAGDFVTSPIWQAVGKTQNTTVSGLPLVDGARYVFAVRALSPDGPSVDVASDGVVVHFPSALPGDGGSAGNASGAAGDVLMTGRACGCRGAGRPARPAGAAICGLALAMAFALRRRTTSNRFS